MTLKDKRIVIIGGTSGIGLASFTWTGAICCANRVGSRRL